MVSKIDLIIIWPGCFALVGKPAGTGVLIDCRRIPYGHDSKLTVIIYPRRRLMSLFQAPYYVLVITVSPAVTHFSCNRSPEVHTPWHGDRRIGVSCGEGMVRKGAGECGYIFHRIGDHFGLFMAAGRKKADKAQYYQFFHINKRFFAGAQNDNDQYQIAG